MLPARLDDPFSTDRLNNTGDFRAEWDVSAMGKEFTDAFSVAIDDVRQHPAPNPRRKIHAFLGPAGYGKTHLFGRIHHQQQEQVFFVFIPALTSLDGTDKVMQLENLLRWRLIESMLHSTRDFAPFRLQMARLLAPSFVAYFDKLSAGSKAKSADIREALEVEPLTVLELFGHVDALGPYQQLADAVRSRLPHCSGSVLRALVLAASPAADDARWWLRGEADQVPEARLQELQLTDRNNQPLDSPPLADVLLAVAELLRLNRMPLVICFDQLEELLKKDQSGFATLTGLLMAWLQTIPNLLIGVGCMKDVWNPVRGMDSFKSFLDRVNPHDLPPLSGNDAAELVRRRMRTWTDFDPKQPSGWPFDLDSIRTYAEKHQPSPRYFIQSVCAPRFNDWQANNRQGLIRFDTGPVEVPIAELFRQEWAKELEAVQTEKKTATDMQDAELWTSVDAALQIAKLGGFQFEGFRIDAIHSQPIVASKNDPRHSARVTFTVNGQSASVIVVVSKKDNGTAFGHFVTKLDDAMKPPVIGAVVLWPRAQLGVSKTSTGYKNYAEKCNSGTIRPFPLEVHEATFHNLECLRRILLAARTGNLLVGHLAMTEEECRKRIIEARIIAHLKLFEFVFQNWPGLVGDTAPPNVLPTVPPVAGVKSVVLPLIPVSPHFPNMPGSPPVPVVPKSEPTWAETILKQATEYLKKRGQIVQPIGFEVGPTFVRLKVEPGEDADIRRIRKQSENLKMNLKLEHEPLIDSQAGYISIDVQRPDRQTVFLSSLLNSYPAALVGKPVFPAGVGVSGQVEWLNLSDAENCHLLVAGVTGSGKSEFLKSLLAALAARLEPSQIRFWLIDPKRVTFNIDPKCPYLDSAVVNESVEAIPILEQCSKEMERRYKLMQQRKVSHVSELTGLDAVPSWVVVMDEFADMMIDKSIKKQLDPLLKRLGGKARAAGIHLILGTQRPSAVVITPELRGNLPGRIGLQVATERESKLFLDAPDAAYLFGKGDLVWKRGGGLIRLQSPFVTPVEFDRYLRVS